MRIRTDSEISTTISKVNIYRSEPINRRGSMVAAGTFTGFYGDTPIALKA